jgi:hypothetical protein
MASTTKPSYLDMVSKFSVNAFGVGHCNDILLCNLFKVKEAISASDKPSKGLSRQAIKKFLHEKVFLVLAVL